MPERRVLDHRARVLGSCAHPLGGVEEQVGGGLVRGDVRRAEDAPVEAFEQAGSARG